MTSNITIVGRRKQALVWQNGKKKFGGERSLVKLSGLVKTVTKLVTGCLRIINVAIFTL